MTFWKAAEFSAHPRVYTSVDIPYGIKANKRRVVKRFVLQRSVLRETNTANKRGIRVAKLSDRHFTQPKYHAEGRRKENETKLPPRPSTGP